MCRCVWMRARCKSSSSSSGGSGSNNRSLERQALPACLCCTNMYRINNTTVPTAMWLVMANSTLYAAPCSGRLRKLAVQHGPQLLLTVVHTNLVLWTAVMGAMLACRYDQSEAKAFLPCSVRQDLSPGNLFARGLSHPTGTKKKQRSNSTRGAAESHSEVPNLHGESGSQSIVYTNVRTVRRYETPLVS